MNCDTMMGGSAENHTFTGNNLMYISGLVYLVSKQLLEHNMSSTVETTFITDVFREFCSRVGLIWFVLNVHQQWEYSKPAAECFWFSLNIRECIFCAQRSVSDLKLHVLEQLGNFLKGTLLTKLKANITQWS